MRSFCVLINYLRKRGVEAPATVSCPSRRQMGASPRPSVVTWPPTQGFRAAIEGRLPNEEIWGRARAFPRPDGTASASAKEMDGSAQVRPNLVTYRERFMSFDVPQSPLLLQVSILRHSGTGRPTSVDGATYLMKFQSSQLGRAGESYPRICLSNHSDSILRFPRVQKPRSVFRGGTAVVGHTARAFRYYH